MSESAAEEKVLESLSLFVPGNPVSQGRGRIVRVGKFSKIADPIESRNWKNYVKVIASECRCDPLWEGPLRIIIRFGFLRPKSISKKVIWRDKKPDIDNVFKACADALEGIIYRNDSQIVGVKMTKKYSDTPGVSIQIEQIDGRKP